MESTHRERVRAGTRREILHVAREHLRTRGPLGISLRAIARDMGMTAPALYRYYPSLDDLHRALAEQCHHELVVALTTARDAAEPATLARRILATLRGFRDWALGHPAEFGLIFGTPVPGLDPKREREPVDCHFEMVLFELFAELWRTAPFEVPDGDDPVPFSPYFAEQLGGLGVEIPQPVLWVLTSAWIRIYGSVCLEVFGQMGYLLTDGRAAYERELRGILHQVGLAYTAPGR